MRLWSLHPRYLDRQGLTACWREALLAQAVLAGRTRGYRSHPQLHRFAATPDPVATIGAYLELVAEDALARGYRFDRARIIARPGAVGAWVGRLEVTSGQLAHEWQHLVGKLGARSPHWLRGLGSPPVTQPHPLFRAVAGPVAPWEVRSGAAAGGPAG